MSFLFHCFNITLKKHISGALPIILLAYIVAIGGYSALSLHEGGGAVSVGLLSQEKTADISTQFSQYAGEAIRVKHYTNLETMKKDLLLNRIQTGYIISDPPQKVLAFTTPLSLTTKITNIMLTTFIIQYGSGTTGYDTIKKYYPDLEPEYVKTEIQALSDTFLHDGSRMEIYMEYVNESPIGLKIDIRTIYACINLAFSALILLIFGQDIIKSKNAEYYKSFLVMKVNTKLFFTGSFLAVLFTSGLFFTLSNVLVNKIINTA